MNPYFRQPPPAARAPRSRGAFKEFDATELYCPSCKRAVPVRKRLLLIVPDGDKYEYLCAVCSTTVGTKITRDSNALKLIS